MVNRDRYGLLTTTSYVVVDPLHCEWWRGRFSAIVDSRGDLGLDDLTISEILRHSDVQVTRASYIKRVSQKSIDGLDKLETELHRREEIAKIQ
jgi:hypothetical protein